MEIKGGRRLSRMLPLKESTRSYTTGFYWAVEKLGTHTVHGRQEHYRPDAVRKVLKGERPSARLVALIREKVPELLTLSWVCDELRVKM